MKRGLVFSQESIGRWYKLPGLAFLGLGGDKARKGIGVSSENIHEFVGANFIRHIIDGDLASKAVDGVITRFPPEPNGFLHIGHAKSICLNFGLALDYKGHCNLRFDDTNPLTEDENFVEAIKRDVAWLGFKWSSERYASDYYEKFYDFAVQLIQKGKAYVCDLTAEEVKATRGTLTEPGLESPYRGRHVAENLELFARMRAGEFEDGKRTLRAKIDMASGNVNLRDPAIYRIRKAKHHRTGNTWCVYPMYDYAHCLSDYLEGITHSLCTLEFADHRPLYDWILGELVPEPRPHQYEFSRLNLSYTVTSKRKLKALVESQAVAGWDDPRMPTIAGLRRRGFTPASIRAFCRGVGVSKQESVIDMSLLEEALRTDLNENAKRAMCVLRPLKVVLLNFEEIPPQTLCVPNHPFSDVHGTREIVLEKEIFIEADDFTLTPPPKYHRLSPGKEVRLRYACVIKAEKHILGPSGEVIEIHARLDPDTFGKNPQGRKVKGIIHWVPASSPSCEVRLYDRLFDTPAPGDGSALACSSLEVVQGARIEAHYGNQSLTGEALQFERLGYFVEDQDSKKGHQVWNRSVGLRDTWAN